MSIILNYLSDIFKVFIIILCINQYAYNHDIFDKRHSIKYCHFLFINHKFESAFAEFERIKFYEYVNDSIYARALIAADFQRDKVKLSTVYNVSKYKYPNSPILKSAYYITNPDDRKFSDLLAALSYDSLFSEKQKADIKIKMLMKENDWNGSMDFMIMNDLLSKDLKKDLIPIISKGFYTKFKSPAIGAALSAILPGTGKIYSGETADGIINMITVNSLIAGAVRSYLVNPENPWTYVLGGLSLGFYVGNIYGSYHSVKKVNKQKQLILDEQSYKVFNNF